MTFIHTVTVIKAGLPISITSLVCVFMDSSPGRNVDSIVRLLFFIMVHYFLFVVSVFFSVFMLPVIFLFDIRSAIPFPAQPHHLFRSAQFLPFADAADNKKIKSKIRSTWSFNHIIYKHLSK